jgi:hypothetical protein
MEMHEQIKRDAIAPHIRAIADYLYDDCKDFRSSNSERRENHIWSHVAALLDVIGEPAHA